MCERVCVCVWPLLLLWPGPLAVVIVQSPLQQIHNVNLWTSQVVVDLLYNFRFVADFSVNCRLVVDLVEVMEFGL